MLTLSHKQLVIYMDIIPHSFVICRHFVSQLSYIQVCFWCWLTQVHLD